MVKDEFKSHWENIAINQYKNDMKSAQHHYCEGYHRAFTKSQIQLTTATSMLKEFQTTDCKQTWLEEMHASIEAFLREVE